MDSPYSPVGQRSRSPPSAPHPAPAPPGVHDAHSPPLVPVPAGTRSPGPSRDSFDPSYDPHFRPHSHSHSQSHYSSAPPPQDYPYSHQYSRGEDPYYAASSSSSRDPYYHRPPPSEWHRPAAYAHSDPYYRHAQPDYRDAYPYASSRDPYGYPPPRDPYYPNYPPPRDPYYPPTSRSAGWGPPTESTSTYNHGSQPYPSSHPYPPRSSQNAPPPASASPAPQVPTQSTAVSLGPHPLHGDLDPTNDLSIPLLYLARPISLKTFTPLKQRFASNLDLRFVNSLLDLERDLQFANARDRDAHDSNLQRKRRRIWISAVGGTDALVHKVWNETPDKIEWKEIVDMNHLNLELLYEENRVDELLRANELELEPSGTRSPRATEQDLRDEEEQERERGRIEIEANGAVEVGTEQADELDQVLRAVRGDPTQRNNGSLLEPARLGRSSRAGERAEAVVDRFEDMVHEGYTEPAVTHHDTKSEDGEIRDDDDETRSRKRSRHELDEAEQHTAARAARKRLEATCKAPRRNCQKWAIENGVAINDETRMVDDEPVLGERHRGVWDLLGHPLDDISPQIQVLMARAMRDVTYPARLQLYSAPDALEQLNESVPWFVTLLKTIQARYELAGSSSIVPQDPPVVEAENQEHAQTEQVPIIDTNASEEPLANAEA
ncbi:uncharacterized protein JCM15063_001564 [Sporobolomyces koalae]|uniref:uncharacterized protein n=1 Tax=Sporobolomyces koalae TaxID=500713 RepID=UPI003176FC41